MVESNIRFVFTAVGSQGNSLLVVILIESPDGSGRTRIGNGAAPDCIPDLSG